LRRSTSPPVGRRFAPSLDVRPKLIDRLEVLLVRHGSQIMAAPLPLLAPHSPFQTFLFV